MGEFALPLQDDPPVPPENVRVVLPDRVIPLELVYDERDIDGLHQWSSTQPISLTPGTEREVFIQADKLPNYTAIVVGVEVDM